MNPSHPQAKLHQSPATVIRGADDICAPFMIRKISFSKFCQGWFLRNGSESDSIASICCKKIDYARLSLPYFSKDTKSLLPSALAKISLFYMMKMFEHIMFIFGECTKKIVTTAKHLFTSRLVDEVDSITLPSRAILTTRICPQVSSAGRTGSVLG